MLVTEAALQNAIKGLFDALFEGIIDEGLQYILAVISEQSEQLLLIRFVGI